MGRLEELKELKDELLSMAVSIKNNIKKAEEEIKLMGQQSPNDEGDYAILINDTLIDDVLITKQYKKLEEIELALDKISSIGYGICEMCEESIDIERLKVKPFAKYCIYCREINEQELLYK